MIEVVVERRVKLLEAEGIHFVTGTAVGRMSRCRPSSDQGLRRRSSSPPGSTIPATSMSRAREQTASTTAMDFLVANTKACWPVRDALRRRART